MSTKTTKTTKTTKATKSPKALKIKAIKVDEARDNMPSNAEVIQTVRVGPRLLENVTNTTAASQTEQATAMTYARHEMLKRLPALHAKYGSPTLPEGANPADYEVSKYMREEYVETRLQIALAALSKLGREVNTLRFQAAHNVVTPKEESNMSKAKKEVATEQAPSSKEPKVDRIETPHGSFIKGSVLHSIYRSFDLKGGATKEEIMERLLTEHCAGLSEAERAARKENFVYTINTQIYAMPKARGFELGRDEQGRYGLHIEGYYKGRVLTAEQKAKAAAAEKAKAEKAAAKEAKAKAKVEAAAAKAKAAEEKAAKEAKVTANVPAQVVGKLKATKK